MPDNGASPVLLVTGTGTDVGKTVVTAAMASLGIASGRRVAVIKPAQTGVADHEAGDVDEIVRLVNFRAPHGRTCVNLTCVELARYADPLAPRTAARRAGREPVSLNAIVDVICDAATSHDLVLVEGAGGLLVQLDEQAHTLADVGVQLQRTPYPPSAVVVASPGLGTLNTTALTTEALRHRNLDCKGIVIGRWPSAPDLAARSNLSDLPTVAHAPLLGVLPDGLSARPQTFAEAARQYLCSDLGGDFDAPAFVRQFAD